MASQTAVLNHWRKPAFWRTLRMLYVLGASLPGVGGISLLCPGVIGIVSQRWGMRQGALLAVVSSVIIGMSVGFANYLFSPCSCPGGTCSP